MRTISTARRLAATIGAATLLAALGAPTAALATGGDCQPLVTHRPGGSDGDTAAVAITSQALVAGAPGWEHVGWEAGGHTTVTEVGIVREDSTEHRTDGDLRAGTAQDVLELRFCGTTEDDGSASHVTDHTDRPAGHSPDDEMSQAVLAAISEEPAPLVNGGLLGLLVGAVALAGGWAYQRGQEARR